MPVTPISYSASSNFHPSSDMNSGGLGPRSGLQSPQNGHDGSDINSAAFLEQQGVVRPDDPRVRQVQIDDTLKAMHLDPHGWPVQYYPNMELGTDRDGKPNQDYGRTTGRVGAQIAPKAFEGSKGVLRSTLDHEVGGHIGQLINHTFSGPGEGNYMNEVEAYDRELRDAKENGLTDAEIADIRSSRNWYLLQLDAENQARIKKGIYTPHR